MSDYYTRGRDIAEDIQKANASIDTIISALRLVGNDSLADKLDRIHRRFNQASIDLNNLMASIVDERFKEAQQATGSLIKAVLGSTP